MSVSRSHNSAGQARSRSSPSTPPDADKLCRALGDALTMAGVIKDDARITTWHATKKYHPQGWTGAHITIKEDPCHQ
ncbi:RusA family crossover junction endodeoxyribonuclease [Corynebacterium striatum]|nr:RusA family crossover junction endodeoxyribonuclease [Corynebacterium striatum]HCG2985075.1 RusA family crossover junction endodeoxyribonuclease [Corynebacterium striatum]HCG3001102.1 RusA family crossover junction endodeoxyribonuclease [Corynebacterium striatum]HCG3016749.1 RusA family crossover junction endodeoxyribonuclease [Corynebacterium striatum]HCG3143414.1 RusA family crossover junction endodeoxyribonuclease [Corynebacterium striatum]